MEKNSKSVMIDNTVKLKETYNRIAEDWHQDHQSDNWWVESTDKFVCLLKPGGLVLDVGCGAGTKSKYLISKGLKVIGIDIADKMIDIARKEVPSGKFLVMDLADAGGLEHKFDGVFIQAVLLHVPKKEVVQKLAPIVKMIKPKGYLYVAVKEKKENAVDEEIKVEEDYGYKYERFFSYFTAGEIKTILEELGLTVIHESAVQPTKTRWINFIGQK